MHRLLSDAHLLPAAGVFLGALAATALATRSVLGWLRRRAILDHPNERSSHRIPTPRGGGLAVVPVVLLGWISLTEAGAIQAPVWPILAIAALLMAVSWLDDRRGLPAGLRLAIHLAAAIAGVLCLPDGSSITQGLLPPVADRVLAVLAWAWFANLFNFMDGIDGIAGTETAAIGLGIAAVAAAAGTHPSPEALVLAGAACGFLVWNWHPAKIFLGDVGSVPLGFLLGWLLIGLAARGQWAAALILPAYYLADATITLIRRAIAGEKIWQAHRQHFYQIATRGGASHAAVVRWVAAANILLIALACESIDRPVEALVGAAIVVAPLLAKFAQMGRSPR